MAGSDDAGAVQVVLDAAGQLIEVTCADSWRRTVGSDGPAPAVLAAVADGQRRWLTTWASSLGDSPDRQGRR